LGCAPNRPDERTIGGPNRKDDSLPGDQHQTPKSHARTAVVTGAAGFIGSHLVDRLLADGHRVIAVDDLSIGRAGNLDSARRAAEGAEGEPRFAFHRRDVAEDPLDDLFAGADWVFHLAALADIVPSIEQPEDYHRANVDGTVRVLEAARRAGVGRFLYAASSSCYGIPDETPTPESAPLRPMYPYALTKCIGEQYVLHWAQTYGLPALSLRMFNVYGPRHRTTGAYGAVFGVFLAQKLAGKPFTIVGDGTQSRDFTYVTDVADAFVTAAGSEVAGEILNIGSGGHYSVNRLVELLGGDSVRVPRRPGEPDITFADTRKIESLLNWRAKVPFEEGVKRMLDSIELYRDAPVWEPDSIARATADWFRYLGTDEKSRAGAAG
jgi:UDP-glucose 4-epimerase